MEPLQQVYEYSTRESMGNTLQEFSNHLKLSQTLPKSYQIEDIVNPSYCHVFNLTVI